jgi:hypothetical protein
LSHSTTTTNNKDDLHYQYWRSGRLTSFTLFSDPRFPAEMRRNIWKVAIQPPRLVKIKVTTRGVVLDPNYDAATWYPKSKMKKTCNGLIFSTHSELSILLSVNAES